MSSIIFIVVCKDRHVDDVITVHVTRESADSEIERFKSEYERDGLEWHERDYGRKLGWVRYVDVDDTGDGPSARIQVSELRGSA